MFTVKVLWFLARKYSLGLFKNSRIISPVSGFSCIYDVKRPYNRIKQISLFLLSPLSHLSLFLSFFLPLSFISSRVLYIPSILSLLYLLFISMSLSSLFTLFYLIIFHSSLLFPLSPFFSLYPPCSLSSFFLSLLYSLFLFILSPVSLFSLFTPFCLIPFFPPSLSLSLPASLPPCLPTSLSLSLCLPPYLPPSLSFLSFHIDHTRRSSFINRV